MKMITMRIDEGNDDDADDYDIGDLVKLDNFT